LARTTGVVVLDEAVGDQRFRGDLELVAGFVVVLAEVVDPAEGVEDLGDFGGEVFGARGVLHGADEVGVAPGGVVPGGVTVAFTTVKVSLPDHFVGTYVLNFLIPSDSREEPRVSKTVGATVALTESPLHAHSS